MERTTIVDKKAEVVQNHADMPVDHVGNVIPVGAEYPRDPVILDHRDDHHATKPKKQGLGAKIKGMFGGKKNKHGHGDVVVDEHVHQKTTTTTTTTTYEQPMQGSHHLHGPLVANPYAQPAHGQIFVPANTAVQANPETGALLPASSLNGPVILPTGPKVIPIGTNYPAGEAGPMVIPPSGGFINNSGNPYLTQQSYGPSGVVQNTYVHERDVIDSKAAKKLEKEEMKRQKELEKEHARLHKDELKREKQLEKEHKELEKDQLKLAKQMEKDQVKLDKQITKDQEKIVKDQQKLENTLQKDQVRAAENEMKLQNRIEKNEAKLVGEITEDQAKIQQTMAKDLAAPHTVAAPINTAIDTGAHGVKHVYAEETKHDAYTGQVLDHNVYHKDTRF